MVEPKRNATKNSTERAQAYSRSIIAKVTLPHNVGFLGREHVAMVVHMHNELANLVLGNTKLEAFGDFLWEKIDRFKVQVLMGDFNMSLFRVIPELRSRGAVIDLGAWYPWESLEGKPMSDSCGILFVNMPGVYTLNKSLGDIHARDATGVLACAEPVEKITDVEDGKEESDAPDSADEVDRPKRLPIFDRIKEDAGPGMPLGTYLPTYIDFEAEMTDTFTPFGCFGRSCGTRRRPQY